jgi:hypothetical protein
MQPLNGLISYQKIKGGGLWPSLTMLYRMSYCSLSQQPVTHALVRELLMVSRFNNRRDHISGMLLADGSRFMQVLEGPEAAVRAMYHDIQADPRHRCVVELMREKQATERWYPNWSMGYAELSAHELSHVITAAIARLAGAPTAAWARSAVLLPSLWEADNATQQDQLHQEQALRA